MSPGTFEHWPRFQSTEWWGMSNPDWTVGSSWWKKASHYLPQKKTKDFSGIYKVEEDKKVKNENYYWKLFSFFGNDLLNNFCTSPGLPSLQPALLQDKKTHLKECCWSFVVKMLLILWFFSASKKGILLVTTVKRKERKFILYLKHQDGRGWEHLLFLLADGDNSLRTFDWQWESCSWQMAIWTLHPALTVASGSWQIDKSLVAPRSDCMLQGKIHLSQAFPQPAEKPLTQILHNKSVNSDNTELQIAYKGWISLPGNLVFRALQTFKKLWSYYMNCSSKICILHSQYATTPK